MIRRKKRPGSPLLIAVAILLSLASLTYYLWATVPTTNPGDALFRARSLLTKHEASDITTLLKISAQDPKLEPWAQLLRAQLQEKLGDKEDALDNYRKVAENSAAFYDAKVSILRLDGSVHASDIFSALEEELRRVRRFDLAAECALLAVTKSQLDGPSKVEALLNLRERYARSPLVHQARKTLEELIQGDPQLRELAENKYALRSIALLIKEREPALALEQAQAVKQKLEKTSPLYFQLLLLEEQILRALRRNEEADHLLSVISADGDSSSADKAMLKMAKNSWNSDDYDAALSVLDSLQQRFPQTSSLSEALYVRARILEETQQLPDAKETYLQINTSSADIAFRLRAIHRIAWLYLRTSSYINAAQYFSQLKTTALEAINTVKNSPPGNALSTADFLDEYFHAIYWEAHSLSMLSDSEKESLKSVTSSPQDLWQLLSEQQPFGYYGLLAKKQLLSSTTSQPNLLPPFSLQQCGVQVSDELQEIINKLHKANLSELAQYEIDAFLGRSNSDLNAWPYEFTRIVLYHQFAPPHQVIAVADAFMRKYHPDLVSQHIETSLADCWRSVAALNYPLPFRETFLAAAKSAQFPVAVLYAIARTESHFDPAASSSAGAVGIAQLLPGTAKLEGILPEQDLFDVRTNLELSARHLRRLYSQYGNHEIYAIAAYNAGASAVNRWKTRYPEVDPYVWVELIGYPETKDYVKKVLVAKSFYESQEKDLGAKSDKK